MSAIESVGRRRRAGSAPTMPARGASVPLAKPLRSIASANTVYARSSGSCRSRSYVSAGAIRNSSVSTASTYWPLACTTVIGTPGTRTSKYELAAALITRNSTRSPGWKMPVQFVSGASPLSR